MAASKLLADKKVVITGGTTGIGLATAVRFIEEGATVMITGRSDENLAEASVLLGPKAIPVKADVQSIADLEHLAERASSELGQVDVLFANAGIGVFSPIEEVEEAAFDSQFNINVKGVYFTVQQLLAVVPRGGSIILTASAVNEKGVATGSLYFATKAAVRSFARSLAAELGPKNIRVNSLSPGIVPTHFSEKVNIPQEAFQGFMDMVVDQAPLGRAGTPNEIASAATFLASEDSAYMTGGDLVVDGGWMNV